MFQERYNRIVLPLFFLSDLIFVNLSYYYFHSFENIFINLLISAIWLAPYLIYKPFYVKRTFSTFIALRQIIITIILFSTLYLLIIAFNLLPLISGYKTNLNFLFINALILIIFSYLRYIFFYKYRLKGKNTSSAILLASDISISDREKINEDAGHLGFNIVNIFQNPELYLFKLEKLAKKNKIKIVFLKESSKSLTNQISTICDQYGIRLRILLPISEYTASQKGFDSLGGYPFIDMHHEPLLFLGNRFFKRLTDILISLISILLVLLWLPIVVKIIQIFTYPGPLFFVQDRIGHNGKKFKLYKFRTMYFSDIFQSASRGISEKTTINDKRISWFGNLLRKTNLDEYPQFINVLLGNMSTVGPRPHMIGEDSILENNIPRYKMRRFVKPGVTGWAAINGYRGGTNDINLMVKRTEYDIWYIENWSFFLDLKIIFITIWQMITFKIPKAY